MFIQKHRVVLFAAVCLVVTTAVAVLLFIHPDAMPVLDTDSSATVSRKPDVKYCYNVLKYGIDCK